ncbi:MAG: ParB N-terminal domain-containing protein [Candidatus Caldarchaeum sp.]|nr:ParB N-terminal domain-containing protein [Candidatus Caldarchaeum sp.]MDW8063593.1 ParB N-terminal domain-containing protein [Candidatus Caldarchaeum sp.]
MGEVVFLDVGCLRKSVYNPRLVQDPDRHRILVESIRREGVKQPLLVYPVEENIYEVLDGSRRLEAAKQANIQKIPCIIIEHSNIPQTSLAIHFSQEDLTDEELVVYVERLVAEEIFKNIDEACRFLGVSKTWYYALKKAVKHRHLGEHLPVSAVALVEKTLVDEEKKKQVVEILQSHPLPKPVLQQALKEIAAKPNANPAEIVEKHYWSTPRRTDENTVSATASYEYLLRTVAGVVVFEARKGVETVWRVQIPLNDVGTVKLLWQKF